jgi:hypothetical protein
MAKRVGVCGFNLLVIDTENKARPRPCGPPRRADALPRARACAAPVSLAAMHQGGLTCWS